MAASKKLTGISGEDEAVVRSLKSAAKIHAKNGLSPAKAMRKAVDEEIASVEHQLVSVVRQASNTDAVQS